MGQKVNPISFRIDNGNKRIWNSNWFSKNKNDYVNNVVDDLKIQDYFKKESSKYSVGSVNIERQANKPVKIMLSSGKISFVIGKKGENIEQVEKTLKKTLMSDKISLDVKEIKYANLNANIVARMICDKIEKRQSFKRAVKSAIESVMKAGASGIKED